jgi:hypothetical protein
MYFYKIIAFDKNDHLLFEKIFDDGKTAFQEYELCKKDPRIIELHSFKYQQEGKKNKDGSLQASLF